MIGARFPQPLLIDVARRSLLWGLQVRRCHRQAYEWLFRPAFPGLDHGVHIGHGVAEIGHLNSLGTGPQCFGQADQACGVRFVGGIPHRDQGRVLEPQALLKYEAG